MTKGSDSREFFEIFKPPQKEEDIPKNEDKPLAEPTDVSSQPRSPISEDNQVTKPTSKVSPLEWIKSTRTEDTAFKGKLETPITPYSISASSKNERITRKDEVILRQETLIIGAIAATFLSIACFFVGHKVGYNKGVMHQEEEWLETIEPQQDGKKTGFIQPQPLEVPQKATSKVAPIKTEKQVEQPKPIVKEKPIIKDKWTLRVVSYKNTKENIEKSKEVARMLQDKLGYDAFVVNTGKELFICVGEFEANDSADLISTQKAIAEFSYENKKPFGGCYPVLVR